jgi:hypothetical protein
LLKVATHSGTFRAAAVFADPICIRDGALALARLAIALA